MSKVVTFSRYFPSYHPRKGEHTFFVEKILKGMGKSLAYIGSGATHPETQHYELCKLNTSLPMFVISDFVASMNNGFWLGKEGVKYHTIRAGKRWKVGDKFSPRVWSGKPYASKQIIIADDIEIKKVWDFYLLKGGYYSFGDSFHEFDIYEIAKNDGLDKHDFDHWFKYPKEFGGQIICWDENINY